MKYCIFIAFAAIYAFSYTFAGFVVPTPPTDGYVVDEVGVLTIEQRYTLNQTIIALETTTKHQIGIVFVQSLQDRSIEEASLAVARSWGIGHKGVDNGLLIFVAPREQQVRIEVGRGLEGVMTDLRAYRIIDEYLIPAFKEQDYFRGVSAALEVIGPLITGEIVDLPDPPMNIEGVFWSLLFWLIWGGFFLGAVFFEPSKAWWPGMVIGVLIGGVVMWFMIGTLWSTLLGMILSGSVLGGMDWAFSTGKINAVRSRPHGGRWGGGGGFGGGSFGGGFGGGGFGGGGASGRW